MENKAIRVGISKLNIFAGAEEVADHREAKKLKEKISNGKAAN